MSTETLSCANTNGHDMDGPFDLSSLEDQEPPQAVLVRGGGANSLHAYDAGGLRGPVHVADFKAPQFPVNPENTHDLSTPEGREEVDRLIAQRAFRSTYISVPAAVHASLIIEDLEHVANNELSYTVTSKPAVRDIAEMRLVNAKVKEVHGRLPDLSPNTETTYDPKKNGFLFIHEHYTEKGAWLAVLAQFTELTKRLGRLQRMTSTIAEARTIEEEGRTVALEDGVLEDLSPHLISQALDAQEKINANPRYTVSSRSKTTVERSRYEGSELREGVETGFKIRSNTPIIDNETGTEHEVEWICGGYKGADADHKAVVFEFIHPDTGIETTVTVDLRANTLQVPEAVQDLFPQTEFNENGYGKILEIGLTENPEVLQSWEQAQIVIKMMRNLVLKSRHAPVRLHPVGTPIEDLA